MLPTKKSDARFYYGGHKECEPVVANKHSQKQQHQQQDIQNKEYTKRTAHNLFFTLN